MGIYNGEPFLKRITPTVNNMYNIKEKYIKKINKKNK